jgi:hypothetical protein
MSGFRAAALSASTVRVAPSGQSTPDSVAAAVKVSLARPVLSANMIALAVVAWC